MKFTLLFTGKSDRGFISDGISHYEKRIRRYVTLVSLVIPLMGKAGSVRLQKEKEGNLIISKLPEKSYIVLLDERGGTMTSEEFARFIRNIAFDQGRDMTFVFGGPYGVSGEVRDAADQVIRLSSMTFSHQVVRILFMEQLYRAFTIIRGEPYHHD